MLSLKACLPDSSLCQPVPGPSPACLAAIQGSLWGSRLTHPPLFFLTGFARFFWSKAAYLVQKWEVQKWQVLWAPLVASRPPWRAACLPGGGGLNHPLALGQTFQPCGHTPESSKHHLCGSIPKVWQDRFQGFSLLCEIVLFSTKLLVYEQQCFW